MEQKYKILWCDTFFDGPHTGMCLGQTNNEKYWFVRKDNEEKIVEEVNSKKKKKKSKKEEFLFELYYLDFNLIKELEEDRKKYCEFTGKGFYYGDPDKIIEIKNFDKFNHKILMYAEIKNNIPFKDNIKEEDFINFYVPHEVIEITL